MALIRCSARLPHLQHFVVGADARNTNGNPIAEIAMPGYRPTSARTHDKEGRCTLCGEHAALTYAHVPPKAAGNAGRSRRAVVDSLGNLVFDRGRDGGMGLYAHCESCRATTSPWDDEYIAWAESIARVMLRSEGAGRRDRLMLRARSVRPGRFARSAIAGMTGLTEGMVDSHPSFVEAIRSGRSLTNDTGMHFYVGVTEKESRPLIEGAHKAVVVSVDMSSGASTSRGALTAISHFPPFSLVLATPDAGKDLPHWDCTDLLRYGTDDTAEDFALELPVVRLALPDQDGVRVGAPAVAATHTFAPGLV